MKILIVDDDEVFRKHVTKALARRGYGVGAAASGEDGVQIAENEIFNIAFIDMNMMGLNGIDVIRELKEIQPALRCIILTGYGSISNAVEAVKAGAYNYLTKPCSIDEIEESIIKVDTAKISNEEDKLCLGNYHGIVGKTSGIQRVISTIHKIKDSMLPVLICGESGTGKELTARALHFDSQRKEKPFVAINCASLKPELLENELFGHIKGAFTGAVDSKNGLLKVADGGTLFIDEIGDMNPIIQASMLRFLETGVFRPLGSTREIKVDVRIIAAINKNIEEEVKAKRFRHDLYYRLNVCRIDIPPLRERREDIPAIVDYFLKSSSIAKERSITLSNSAIDAMLSYNWTGNIRELFNTLNRAILLSNEPVITCRSITSLLSSKSNVVSKPSMLYEMEKKCLLENLNANKWNITLTAKLLGIDRRTLQRKISMYQLR
ncbi:MAG: sigma-54-dependent Fis family transcriptional regulator [Deltaproteobacteria bacterium]|nr:sigma-54-dependent Fis family transcriptional regulator [Deltaproteobacteria bacterium]